MVTTPGGRWIEVGNRTDWVPEQQPDSPDGTPGLWCVVREPDDSLRWEWWPAPPDWRPPPPMPPGPPPGTGAPSPRRPPVVTEMLPPGRDAFPARVADGTGRCWEALVSLVLGSVGVLLCPIPIVNNGAAAMGILGALFGGRARRTTCGPYYAMATAGLALSFLAFAGTIAAQALIEEWTEDLGDSFSRSFR